MSGMSRARHSLRALQLTQEHAVLPQTSIQPQLSRWFNEANPSNDFPAWLAERTRLRTSEVRVEEFDSISSRSTGIRSPVPVHVRSEMSGTSSAGSTTATNAVPRLTRGQSLASSLGPADTSAASALDGGYVLSIQENGLLTVPERTMPGANLLCPFQILDCEDVFSDIREFKTHVFSHFKGQPAPLDAACFLCDETFDQTEIDDPALAWNSMLSHLANDHYGRGQRLAAVRTDFSLMRWMYSRRMISDAQLKRCQLCPRPILLPNTANEGQGIFGNIPFAPMPPSAPLSRVMGSSDVTNVGEQNEPFTLQAGRRAERRRRDATRVMHSRGNL